MTASVLRGFDDPAFSGFAWNALLPRGSTNEVFLTHEYQHAWWESFERSGLMLLLVRCEDQPKAIAPFFAEEGMIYFVGAGGSDYLDFIGDIAGVLELLLSTARELVDGFAGFRLHHVPEDSRTTMELAPVAHRLGLVLRREGSISAPRLLLTDPEQALAVTEKKSLLRHERYFRREGELLISHSSSAEAIAPQLECFLQQHIERWKSTAHASLFNDPRQRRFYANLTQRASQAGWLRFTSLRWRKQPIAFHYGFSYRGSFMWYKPSFDVVLAQHSPGEVLLRQLLLRAVEEQAHTFDFGLGDEGFKQRFATASRCVHDWGLYPANKLLPELW